jgi:hypothetical protein
MEADDVIPERLRSTRIRNPQFARGALDSGFAPSVRPGMTVTD